MAVINRVLAASREKLAGNGSTLAAGGKKKSRAGRTLTAGRDKKAGNGNKLAASGDRMAGLGGMRMLFAAVSDGEAVLGSMRLLVAAGRGRLAVRAGNTSGQCDLLNVREFKLRSILFQYIPRSKSCVTRASEAGRFGPSKSPCTFKTRESVTRCRSSRPQVAPYIE